MLKPGYTFVSGRKRDHAKGLIEAARLAGYPTSVVKTKENGYVVPNDVYDLYRGNDEPVQTHEPPPSPEQLPRADDEQGESADDSPEVDLDRVKLKDLQAQAERRGLPTWGSKAVLYERLTNKESE